MVYTGVIFFRIENLFLRFIILMEILTRQSNMIHRIENKLLFVWLLIIFFSFKSNYNSK